MTTPAIANLIREGKTYQVHSSLQAGRAHGMHTMDQHLAELVNSGQVAYGSAIEKVHDPEDFKRLVHRTYDSPGAAPDGPGNRFERGPDDVERRHLRIPRSRRRRQGGQGKLEAGSKAAVVSRLRTMGLAPIEIQESGDGNRTSDRHLARVPRQGGRAQGSGHHGPSDGDDGRIGTFAAAHPDDPLRADGEQETQVVAHAGARPRRIGHLALGRLREIPGGVPRADDPSGARGRGGRFPRRVARIRSGDLREGRQAPPDHQVGDDLSRGRAHHGARRHGRNARLHRARLPEDVRVRWAASCRFPHRSSS